MKHRHLFLGFLTFSGFAHATLLTWDSTPGTAGIQNQAGIWDNITTNNWQNAGVNSTWDSTTPDDALFGSGTGGAGGAITIAAGGVTAGTVTFGTPQSGNFSLIGGSLQVNTLLTNSGTNNVTVNSLISGTGGLTRVSGGRFILTANNTYSGGTIINSNASIQLGDNTLSSGSIVGAITNNGTVVVSRPDNHTLSNSISGTGALTISSISSGTTGISGRTSITNANTFTGAVSITAGILRIENNDALGLGAKTVATSSTGQSVSMIELANNVTITDKTLNNSGKNYYGNGASTVGNAVFLRNVSGVNTWDGNIQIVAAGGTYAVESLAGKLVLGGSAADLIQNTVASSTRPLDVRAGDVDIKSTIQDSSATSISSFQQLGTGTVRMLNDANTFTGSVVLASGSVEVGKLANTGSPSSLGQSTSAIALLGAKLNYVGGGDSTNRAISINARGAELSSNGAGPINFTNTAAVVSSTTVSDAIASGFAVGATTLKLYSVHTLAAGMGITGTNIAAGTKITAVDYNTREISINTPTSGASVNAQALTISGQSDLNRTLKLSGASTADNTFAGLLENPAGAGLLGLEKNDGGKWILTGASTFDGPIDVHGGTLIVNGSMSGATGNITVDSGAVFGGGGTIGGALAISSGGTLAPGNSPGTLTTTSSLTLQGGSILQYDLNGANTQVGSLVNDLTTGITTLTLDGILNITETTPNSFLSASFGDKWRLMNYSVSLTDNGLALGSTPALANGYTFKVDTSTPGQVNLMVIPEPSSAAWLAACSMMLLTRRRSRRAAKC